MTSDGNAAAAIWSELSETMRRLRQSAGHSIRWTESQSGRGRGLLSQVETGKARPNRGLVEWYDGTFDGDGLLLSLFFEARTAHGPDSGARTDVDVRDGSSNAGAGARLLVLDQLLPHGAVVPPASHVPVGWTVRNDGVTAWTSVRLRRVGTPASSRMLSGPALLPVPDTAVGATSSVTTQVRTPEYVGTYAAFWELIDTDDRLVVPGVPLSALVIVRS